MNIAKKVLKRRLIDFLSQSMKPDASCECCARGEYGGTDALERNSEDNGEICVCVSKNRLGDSGESAGEPKLVSSGAADGMIEILGQSAVKGDAAAGETGEI
ncbi:unnamed protein product [Lathyrus sativus]|nr:unnamed protein product [Lathyrus sativus]